MKTFWWFWGFWGFWGLGITEKMKTILESYRLTAGQTSPPTDGQRQRQRHEREAFRLIEELATLRHYWQPADVPPAVIDTLVEDWSSLTITNNDVAALRGWDGLPLTLVGLLETLTQQIESASDFQL
ncbi:MAG: hypothetical protein ACI8W8_003377 [Rhodothermales bacterium]|jgi:hypothetical protein